MFNRHPARGRKSELTSAQRIVLAIINGGYSELGEIQALAADEKISEQDAYYAAKFLRTRGYVKGVKRPYLGEPREDAPPFRWCYEPFTAEDIAIRDAPVEEKIARVEATIARLKAGRKPPPGKTEAEPL